MSVFSQSPFGQVYRHFDTNGDGSGAFDAIGDYRAAPVDFFFQPDPGEVIPVARILFIMKGPDIGKGGYGQALSLTNGITMQHTDAEGNVIVSFTDLVPIRDEADWAGLCYNFDPKGKDAKAGRFTVGESGLPTVLKNRDRFAVTLNDDFRHLTAHHWQAQAVEAKGLYTEPE